MPYKLDQFPIETSEPKIEVDLPEGKHTFELIVEDSAGRQSLVDTVTITVKKEQIPPPKLDEVDPDFVTLGKDKIVKISGNNLETANAVRFLRGDAVEPRVTAMIDFEKVKNDHMLVTIVADAKTPVNEPYSVEVITQAGAARLNAAFRVVPEPKIKDFAPKRLGVGEDAHMIIEGTHLFMKDPKKDRLAEHKVEFLKEGESEHDPAITVKIDPESSAQDLRVEVSVKKREGKVAPGVHYLRVTTPAGSNVAKKTFEVTQE